MKKTGREYEFERLMKVGKYVRLTGKAIVGLNRLREAYGMERRESVLEYLVEQGVAGLDGTQPEVVNEGGHAG